MDLDKITIAMRPRSNREAMDLGLSLLQNNWRVLYPPLLLIIIPLFLLVNILFSSHMWIAALVIWWLKPLYDRLLLFILSRSLFSDTPGTAQTLAAFPGLMKKGLLWQLTLLRFSPTRSFTLPVWILEGLSGKSRRQRIQVLNSRTSGNATWLLILCLHLEFIILISLYILILIFLPQSIDMDSLAPLFAHKSLYWLEFTGNFLYLIAMLIIEPFYVAAGFMLYINRRNQLEAWDIEIQFRRIAQRLALFTKKATVMAASVLLVIFIAAQPAITFAEETTTTPSIPDKSKRIITEVLQHKDFGTEKEEAYWTLKNIDPKEKKNNFSFDFGLGPVLAAILKFILIGLLIAFIIYLILKARYLTRPKSTKKEKNAEPPKILFGMNITPDSLPEDITAVAIRLWSNKQYREALGLLYRGSLSFLVNEDHVLLNNSMTEQDILECARGAKLRQSRITYLDKLTRTWQTLAYAHRLPEEADIQFLFKQWSIQFSPVPPP